METDSWTQIRWRTDRKDNGEGKDNTGNREGRDTRQTMERDNIDGRDQE